MTIPSPSDAAAARERNRASFPEIARIMDDFRRVFGDGCKLVWAKDGEREIGKEPDYMATAIVPPMAYVPSERSAARKGK